MEIKKPNFGADFPSSPVRKQEINKEPLKTEIQLNQVGIEKQEKTAPNVPTENNKGYKKVIISLVAILLAVIAVVTIILIPKPTQPKDIYVKLEINDITSSSFDYSDLKEDRVIRDASGQIVKFNLFPGDYFYGTFGVKCLEDEEISQETGAEAGPVFVRFRMYATTTMSEGHENYYGNIINVPSIKTNTNYPWTIGFDGYIYYNKLLNPSETAEITPKIELSGENIGNEFSNKQITLHIVFEVLQTSEQQSILEMWPTAPYQWKKEMAKIYVGE